MPTRRRAACLIFSAVAVTSGVGLMVAALGSMAAGAQTAPVKSQPTVNPQHRTGTGVAKLHHLKPGHSGHITKAAAAAISISPDTGLQNNQSVTITLTNFTGASTVVAIECAPAPTPAQQQAYCDANHVDIFPISGGAGSTQFKVLTGAIGSGNCGAAGSKNCSITVANIIAGPPPGNHLPNASADIVFASQAVTTTTTGSTTSTTSKSSRPTAAAASNGSTTSTATGNTSASGASTTGSSASGSSASSGSSGSSGSSDPSSSNSASLASTGAPADTMLMVEIALALIGAGVAAMIIARRRRDPAPATDQR